MSEVIVLSESDEEEQQPSKKIKLDTQESVVISDEEVTPCENTTNNIISPQPSASHNNFTDFLDICAKSIKNTVYEGRILSKFPHITKRFDSCGSDHAESGSFKRILEENIALAKISPGQAVISFDKIYTHLVDVLSETTIEVPENYRRVKKLAKTMKLLLRKIKYLEDQEVDFDDEENSTFIKVERYTKRLNKVYAKYCSLLNMNRHKGRLTYEKLNFVSSKHNEINRAITKNYNNNKTFPTYNDIEKCIKKCVSKQNLQLTESEIRIESEYCFKKLGELLKRRRQNELYESHCNYLTLDGDPAQTDPELNSILKKNQELGKSKMNEIIEKFTKQQDNYVEMNLSEDSDDSHYQNSDDDES